jgi:hypothetical protein
MQTTGRRCRRFDYKTTLHGGLLEDGYAQARRFYIGGEADVTNLPHPMPQKNFIAEHANFLLE